MGPQSTDPYALPDGVAPDWAVCPRCHPGRLILQFNHIAIVVDAKTRCKRKGGDEHLPFVGQEPLAIDRPVEQPGCLDAVN
jgi:hypothetical protein